MNANSFQKVRPGQPMKFPAAVYNKVLDTIRTVQRERTFGGGQDAGASSGAGIVLVRNDSGADAQRFAVMGIDSILVSPTDKADEFYNHPSLSVTSPNGTIHKGKWVILQEPLKNGFVGRAAIAGLAITQITFTDINHKFVDLLEGYATLRSAHNGPAQIVWYQYTGQESTSGWAVLRLGLPLQSDPLDTTGLQANMVYTLRSYGGVLQPTWTFSTVHYQE
jgi:hypothetical protein